MRPPTVPSQQSLPAHSGALFSVPTESTEKGLVGLLGVSVITSSFPSSLFLKS